MRVDPMNQRALSGVPDSDLAITIAGRDQSSIPAEPHARHRCAMIRQRMQHSFRSDVPYSRRFIPTRLPRLKRDDSLSGCEDSRCRRRELPEGMEQSIPRSNVDGRLQKGWADLEQFVPALIGALNDDDPQMRRNAALVVIDLAGAYSVRPKSRVDMRKAIPAPIRVTEDSDTDATAWSAQALAEIGPDAKEAIHALVELLEDQNDGPRNASCIALGRIGPAAKDVLPALREALQDPSQDVRQFAQQAIGRSQIGATLKVASRRLHLHWAGSVNEGAFFASNLRKCSFSRPRCLVTTRPASSKGAS
jgi:hypothetical protein